MKISGMIQDDGFYSLSSINLREDLRPVTQAMIANRGVANDWEDIEVPNLSGELIADDWCEVLANLHFTREWLVIDMHVVVSRNREFDAFSGEGQHSLLDG